MLASCILLVGFSAVIGAAPVQDEPFDFTDKIKQAVTDVNSYLEDHLFAESQLPDLGHFDFEPLKLRKGSLGEFDTIALQGTPIVKERTNPDGTITYNFDVVVGLQKLVVKYEYLFALMGYNSKGNVSVTAQENSVELKGIAVVGSNYCDARLDGFGVAKLGEYEVEVSSDDKSTHIVQILKSYIAPIMLRLVNTSLQGFLLVPAIQNTFSELLCTHVQQ